MSSILAQARQTLMHPITRTLLPAAALLALSACGEPDVKLSEERAPSGVIRGSVEYNGPKRGRVVLFLFDSEFLPPPQGTSRPINFTVVPESEMFASEQVPHSASFTFPLVAPGRSYQVRAYLDADLDFSPFLDTNNQITAGDVGGGHFDVRDANELLEIVAAGGAPPFRNIPVPTLEEAGGDFSKLNLTGINVLLASDTAYERPIFTIDPADLTGTVQRDLNGDEVPDVEHGVLEVDNDFARPIPIKLKANPLAHSLVSADADKTVFTVKIRDVNGDGIPDDDDNDGIPDLFPRVLFVQIDDSDSTALTDLLPQTVIPAIADPGRYLPQLTSMQDEIVTTSLDLLILPAAVQPQPDGSNMFLPGIPEGRWAINVINSSGQTWRLPSALSVQNGAGPISVASQSVEFVTKAPDEPPPSGSISGTVSFSNPEDGRAGNLKIVHFFASNPPPPAGTGTPEGLTTITLDENGTGSFTIRNVEPGAYIVSAFLDVDEDFSAFAGIVAQTTQGDILGGHVGADGRPAVVTVETGDVAGTDVTLVAANAQPLERPSFEVVSPFPLSMAQDADPMPMRLRTVAIDNMLVKNDPDLTKFTVRLQGPGPDGGIIDLNGDGQPDLWPRVLMVLQDDTDPSGFTDDAVETRAIPALVYDQPFLDQLKNDEGGWDFTKQILVDDLDLIVPPVAVNTQDISQRFVPPVGNYAINVINATGQTWRVPNELSPLVAGQVRGRNVGIPSQGALFRITPAQSTDSGSISGTVSVSEALVDDFGNASGAIVFAFDVNNPGPPAGTGQPVGVAIVGATAFSSDEGTLSAPFTVGGLPPGQYIVGGYLDGNGDFNPFSDLTTQPTAGDISGQLAAPVTVVGPSGGIALTLDTPINFERPIFSVDPAEARIQSGTSIFHPMNLNVLDLDTSLVDNNIDATRFLVTPADLDGDGTPDDANADNLMDLLPRVLMVLTDPNDPTGMTSHSETIVIPGYIDPLPYLAAFQANPVIPLETLPVVVPPAAVNLCAPIGCAENSDCAAGQSCGTTQLGVSMAGEVLDTPMEVPACVDAAGDRVCFPAPARLDRIPAGDYSINVVQVTAQTWSIPNELSPAVAGERGVASQGQLFHVDPPEVENIPGSISGTVTAPEAPVGNVYVLLFAANNPPPPEGTGAPLTLTFVTPAEFRGGTTANWRIARIPPGDYTIRAFHDADGNFNPTKDFLAQTTLGDVGGGAIANPGPPVEYQVITVADAPVTDVGVILAQAQPFSRPSFAFADGSAMGMPQDQPRPIVMTLDKAVVGNPLFTPTEESVKFTVGYVDRNADGVPDDDNLDNLPDLWPQILLTLNNDPEGRTVVIPATVNPLPWTPILGDDTTMILPVDQVSAIVTPAAVVVHPDGSRERLPTIPAGEYTINVINATGQTWAIPNSLATDVASQAGVFTVGDPQLNFTGSISGTVTYTGDARGNVYVVLFDADNPPPPDGFGGALGLGVVFAAQFADTGATITGDYVIGGVPPGDYIIQAFLDEDANFSPNFSNITAQTTLGDVGGGHFSSLTPPTFGRITVEDGAVTGRDVLLSDTNAQPFERPSFVASGVLEMSQAATTFQSFTLSTTDIDHPLVDNDLDSTKFAVAFVDDNDDDVPDDINGDNMEDLWPKVLLRKLDDDDPTGLTDTEDTIVIPAIVHALPFLETLRSGVPIVPTDELTIIVPPVAVNLANPTERLVPPAGRYAINVIQITGQTWRVPNELNPAFFAPGFPVADTISDTASQALSFEVTLPDVTPPSGSISGTITYAGAERGDVHVILFDANNPPPPDGTGGPLRLTTIPEIALVEDGGGGFTAAYQVPVVPDGEYQVRAFIDVDDDFTPFYSHTNQTTQGDIGGGAITDPGPPTVYQTVTVTGGSTETANVILALTVPTERPAFTVPTPTELIFTQGAATQLTIAATALDSGLVSMNDPNAFLVTWGPDRTGDGQPDLLPSMILRLLDPTDPTGLTDNDQPIIMAGVVVPSEAEFPELYDGGVPDFTASAIRPTLTFSFSPAAIDLTNPTVPIIPAPAGGYAINLISATGQTWRTPNESALDEASQAIAVQVQP